MKFARYLEDTQTPEWKKAYIDYRGLKKRITAIRTWQEGLEPLPQWSVDPKVSSSEVRHKPSRVSWSVDDRYGLKTSHRRRLSMPTLARSRPNSHQQSVPLYSILLTLPPIHIEFFTYLDRQLAKIDSFYSEREKEAQTRNKALEIQLRELKDHRKIFYEVNTNSGLSLSQTLKCGLQFLPGSLAFGSLDSKHSGTPTQKQRILVSTKGQFKPNCNKDIEAQLGPNGEGISDFEDSSRTVVPSRSSDTSGFTCSTRLDPEEYQYARKQLKKAVLEHYRGLEVLNNYRVLNIAGFRKALKKYQKVTKIPVQQAYLTEKVEASSFASGASIDDMLKQTEELFTARFEQGDKKRAMAKLRAAENSQPKNHHFCTFNSGIALGLALPAFISGVYQSFQPERRAQIPQWDVLLFIYGTLFVPVLFSLMVGINMSVWSSARINYVFIFELDVRTRLDHCEYFEIPAILLATLAYAFWLSFSHVAIPTIWPLVWLGFAAVVILNPLPLLFKSSRWWLVKSIGELLISGLHPVEFIDFWMGDQFCSLVFTISNLYFTICAYSHNFQPDIWEQCGVLSPVGWWMSFFLGLNIHLINAGKYGAGIVYYFCFFLWRHNGNADRGASFVLLCLFGTIYSVYSCSWDFLMDWSFFKRHSKYPLLRSDLVYTNAIPLYYFALISNLALKFVWIWYIPARGPSMTVRTFIAGMLEMLRRWQWNFYRLENEHLGNMDQYRVTREMPLPYQIDEKAAEVDNEDEAGVSRRSWLTWQHRRSNNMSAVYGDDELNVWQDHTEVSFRAGVLSVHRDPGNSDKYSTSSQNVASF